MTKKEQSLYKTFLRSTAYALEHVYTNCSAEKHAIYRACCKRAQSLNAEKIRIPTANSMSFTFAFLYEKEGKKRLQYITKWNTYDFEIDGSEV